jgi:ferredoxin
MEIGGKTVLICNCEATMRLDGKALARACQSKEPFVNGQLCRAQIDNFRAAVEAGRPVLVACTQEAPLFDEVLAETAPETPVVYANIRERAGWSSQGTKATPKIAALLAEAAIELPPTPTVAMKSGGVCLVYGRDEAAIEAARQLRGRLDVTVLLTRPEGVIPPRVMDVPVFKGTIVGARGHLGAFELMVDDYAPIVPSSRGEFAFEPAKDGAASTCDLILDLTGAPALFPAAKKRDGYFNPDPRNPAAVQRALFDLTDLVGEFAKPRYVDFTASICAHSRSRKVGCTRCLEVCPAGAIRPNGDAVEIDPYICGGCGACHSVCPTGAATYAMPPPAKLVERLRTLLGTYYRAGGERAVLLVHDTRQGEELIALLARCGDGLPANVLPFAVNEATQVGFDFLANALAYGAAQIVLLTPPARRDELTGLAQQVGLAEALMEGLGYGGGRVQVLVEADPDGLARSLAALPPAAPCQPGDYLALGDKRSLIRLALDHLHAQAPRPADRVQLAPGAPFGAVVVDVAGCTVCLACVGACPTGALQDNPEKPQLRFQEDACVQCGLCKNTCPEKVIALEPRFNFAPEARTAVLVKEEEPFACVRCGKPFGTRSTVARVLAQLAQKHSMFQSEAMIRSIQMCERCRVEVQFEKGGEPLAFRERPRVRTTEDYLRERDAGLEPPKEKI